MRTLNIILPALLALACSVAQGQAVYRCGNSYSQQPCEGGSLVKAGDARTPADARAAMRVANADQKLADQMEKARLAQEKNAPKALIIGPQTPVKEEPQKVAAKPKGKNKPDQLGAVVPGETKKKKKKAA